MRMALDAVNVSLCMYFYVVNTSMCMYLYAVNMSMRMALYAVTMSQYRRFTTTLNLLLPWNIYPYIHTYRYGVHIGCT
jgi:hypothetical protein